MSDPRRILMLAATLAACSPAPEEGSNNNVASDNAVVRIPQPAAQVDAPVQSDSRASAFTELSESRCRLIEENKLDPNSIPNTGKDGRITKEDVINFVSSAKTAPAPAPAEPDWRIGR